MTFGYDVAAVNNVEIFGENVAHSRIDQGDYCAVAGQFFPENEPFRMGVIKDIAPVKNDLNVDTLDRKYCPIPLGSEAVIFRICKQNGSRTCGAIAPKALP